jgi:hypothetical protein
MPAVAAGQVPPDEVPAGEVPAGEVPEAQRGSADDRSRVAKPCASC